MDVFVVSTVVGVFCFGFGWMQGNDRGHTEVLAHVHEYLTNCVPNGRRLFTELYLRWRITHKEPPDA